ncbi:MAG: nucleotidyltransferase domain-containing protein [Bacteroidota bacterium]
MDKNIIKAIKKFTELANKEFPIQKVILYGSYAKKTQRKESDIDVAVILHDYDGDILKANGKLFALARDIDVRIEPIILEMKYDKSGFIESIIKYGKVIFSAN